VVELASMKFPERAFHHKNLFSSGNMDKAKSLYIKYRAEAIKQDIDVGAK